VLAGHDVVEAIDGPSAVELARQTRPDLAFIDVGLPGFDGYEVARRLRHLTQKDIRLVALTGYGRPEDRARALEVGFDGHIVKPADPDALRAALSSCVPRAPQSLGAMARRYDPIEDAVHQRREARRIRGIAEAARLRTRRLIRASAATGRPRP
jgi:CheY-like chemotaxis protein